MPAVFICCICDKPIEVKLHDNLELIQKPVRIVTMHKNGIEEEKVAHSRCAEGLAGKP